MTHLEMAALAVGWSGGVGGLGLLLLRRRRNRSVRFTLVAITLLGAASLVTGLLAAARAMFISEHDFAVVVEVAAVSAAVALLVALLEVRDVVRDVDLVRRRAASVDSPDEADGTPEPPPVQPRTAELGEIDAELRRTTARLAAARRREQALDGARRELVAWVSHDLRTPLAGIRALAESLEDGLSPDPARHLQQIRREVDRLTGLVDDLFELSRIQAGALRLHLAPVDLREVAHEAVESLGPLAAGRGVVLQPVQAPAARVAVQADRGALARVLTNLVGNAVRYSSSPGTVAVRIDTDADRVTVDVHDTCGGIPADVRERVFEPGWRGSTARTPGPDAGGGLGLAVARGLARAHDGDVTLHDADGGCRFRLTLPLGTAS